MDMDDIWYKVSYLRIEYHFKFWNILRAQGNGIFMDMDDRRRKRVPLMDVMDQRGKVFRTKL